MSGLSFFVVAATLATIVGLIAVIADLYNRLEDKVQNSPPLPVSLEIAAMLHAEQVQAQGPQ